MAKKDEEKEKGTETKAKAPKAATKTSTTTDTKPASTQGAAAPEPRGGVGTFMAAALVVGVLVAGYFYLANVDQGGGVADNNQDNGEQSTADIVLGTDRDSGPVARVNGVEISRKDYENSVVSIAENATAQGLDITDPTIQEEIKDQALTSLINSEVFIQSATAAGVQISAEAVSNEFDSIVAGFGSEEALLAQLAAFDVDQDTLRTDIEEQLIIEAYIAAYVENASVEVTEEEITAFYDSLAAGGQQLPALEEVRAQIEAELIAQKQQALITELLEALRAEATIEILV